MADVSSIRPRDRLAGRALVALQFALIFALAALAAGPVRQAGAPPLAWALLLAGIAIGAWAVTANRIGNFNIRPEPKAGGVLVEQGPYRWIRHPMYTAVLACGLACAVAAGAPAAWFALA